MAAGSRCPAKSARGSKHGSGASPLPSQPAVSCCSRLLWYLSVQFLLVHLFHVNLFAFWPSAEIWHPQIPMTDLQLKNTLGKGSSPQLFA